MGDIGSLILKIGADAEELKRVLDKANRDGQTFGQQLTNAGKIAAIGITAVTTAAIAAGAGIIAIVKSSADAGDELLRLSQKTGNTVEFLSQLKHSAELNDVSIETLGMGFKTLSTSMYEAAGGAKEQSDMFALLGISVMDATGALRPSGDVMIEVADRFATMKDETQRAALAVKLFGKSGLEMIPLLEQGSEAIREQMKEAKLLGVAWSTEAARAADQFNDDLVRMGAVLEGVKNIIASAFLPVLQDIVTEFLDWFKANEAVIKQDLKGWATAAAATLRDMAASGKEVIGALDALRRAWGELQDIGAIDFIVRLTKAIFHAGKIIFDVFVAGIHQFAINIIEPLTHLPGAVGNTFVKVKQQWEGALTEWRTAMMDNSRRLLQDMGLMEKEALNEQQGRFDAHVQAHLAAVAKQAKGTITKHQETKKEILDLERELQAELMGSELKKLATIQAEENKRVEIVKKSAGDIIEKQRLGNLIIQASDMKRAELQRELQAGITKDISSSEDQQRAEAQRTFVERVSLINALIKKESERVQLIQAATNARDASLDQAGAERRNKAIEIEQAITDATLTNEQKRIATIVQTAGERRRWIEVNIADETRRTDILRTLERATSTELLLIAKERNDKIRQLHDDVARDLIGQEEGQRISIQRTFQERLRLVQELQTAEAAMIRATVVGAEAQQAAIDQMSDRYKALAVAIGGAKDKQVQLFDAELVKKNQDFLAQIEADTLTGEQRKRFEIQRTYQERLAQLELLKMSEEDHARATVLIEQARQQQLKDLAAQFPGFWVSQLDMIKQSAVFTWSSIQQSFSSALAGMIQGTTTFAQFWQSMMTTILTAVINLGVQLAVEWVKQLIFKKAKDTEGAAAHTLMEGAKTKATIAAEAARTAAAVATGKAISASYLGQLAAVSAMSLGMISVMGSTMGAVVAMMGSIASALAAGIVTAELSAPVASAAIGLAIAGGIAVGAANAAVVAGTTAAGTAIQAALATPFAKGGIVQNGPVFGMVGEAGPEMVLPLDRAGDVLGPKQIEQTIIFQLDRDVLNTHIERNFPGVIRMIGASS